jgi:hypothetical protein
MFEMQHKKIDLPIEYEPYFRFIARKPECSEQIWKEFTTLYLPHSFAVKLDVDASNALTNKYTVELSDWIRTSCKGVWSCDNISESYWRKKPFLFYFQDSGSAILFKLKYHGR